MRRSTWGGLWAAEQLNNLQTLKYWLLTLAFELTVGEGVHIRKLAIFRRPSQVEEAEEQERGEESELHHDDGRTMREGVREGTRKNKAANKEARGMKKGSEERRFAISTAYASTS
mmetsp:Transcript_22010/g.62717  ORF Transcript_22010/g.62717 Transcript_22010/m.62717 type:complete len:115 (-) Transcript_22010:126-470(-)